MSSPSPLGPMPTAGPIDSHPSLLLWPDAANADLKKANQPELYYYLPKAPRLVRNGKGHPILSLTLVLKRQPTPQDGPIAPLIQQGIVTFAVTFAVAELPTETLPPKGAKPMGTIAYRPLFTREVEMALIGDRPAAATTLATATATSPPAQATLSATLNRDDTLALLSALDGTDIPLNIQSQIAYRVAATEQTLRLSGAWTDIYDFLRSRVSGVGSFSLPELSQHFTHMAQNQVLSVFEIAPNGQEKRVTPSDASLLFDRFLKLSTVILKRESVEFDKDDPQNRYGLRGRPHPMFQLDYQQTYTHSGQTRFTLTTGLAEILGGALDGLDRGQFIHLVAPGVGGGGSSDDSSRGDPNRLPGWGPTMGGLVPVPRRVRTESAQLPQRRSGPGRTMELATFSGSIQSISAALQPSATAMVAPQAIEASSAVPVQAGSGRVKQWWVGNVMVARPKPIVTSLPVIQDANAAIWVDRLDNAKYWYAPTFAVVVPLPTADPETSPFLFTVERTGTTQTGQPALLGRLQITLQQRMSDRTQTALKAQGNPVANPVPLSNLTVMLALPFVDSNDGNPKRHLLTAVVQSLGNQLIATFELSNDWVRLCYGALSSPGFQREAVQVMVSYAYAAYVPLPMEEIAMAYGGKFAKTAVVYSQEDRVRMQSAFLDATTLTYESPQASIRLRPEEPLRVARSPEPSQDRANGAVLASAVTSSALSSALQTEPVHISPMATAVLQNRPLRPIEEGEIRIRPRPQRPSPIVVQPEIEASPELHQILRLQYTLQSLMRQEAVDVVFPCQQFGAFYREQTAGTSVAIGCRDAFKLGQTSYQQYERIDELTHPAYTVYRCLPQPGRFLVVPAYYRITRYDATEGSKAYRPCMIVYLQIDATVATNNRVVFQSMVQPDLSPAIRQELLDKLALYARNPVLEYPTDVVSRLVYTWGAIDQVVPSAVLAPNGLRVILDTDLLHAQLVQNMLQNSGFYGSVQFELPDGMAVQSNISLELSNITGPWNGPMDVALGWSGPVSIGQAGVGNRVTVTNRIERAIALRDLLLYNGTARTSNPLPVETILPPGGSTNIALSTVCDRALPVYTIVPGTATLEEVRSYVEDIHTNVAFVDLVNYDNHNLQRLDVKAQLVDVVGTYTVPLDPASRMGTVDMVLPLTVYLANRTLQFQVTKTLKTGEQMMTAWLNWNLTTQGNIISLTWDMIQ